MSGSEAAVKTDALKDMKGSRIGDKTREKSCTEKGEENHQVTLDESLTSLATLRLTGRIRLCVC